MAPDAVTAWPFGPPVLAPLADGNHTIVGHGFVTDTEEGGLATARFAR